MGPSTHCPCTVGGTGEYGPLHAMHALLRTPYEEHPEVSERYYQRAPRGAEKQGGIGFMS